MLWPFKEAKNDPSFCIISLENSHLRIIYLGLAFAQVKGSFATDFNGNSQRTSFSGDAEAFLKLVISDFTQCMEENA